MEDSYTVHRRRKAAARKREKTPEPPRRRHEDDVEETDEEEERRARMERMVQETEMLEVIGENVKKVAESGKSGDETAEKVSSSLRDERAQRSLKRAVSPEVRGCEEEKIRENVEKVDAKLCNEVPRRNESDDKLKKETRGLIVEVKKTSGSAETPSEVEDPRGRDDATLRKARKDATGSSTKRRRDPAKDSSPEVALKSTSDVRKVEPKEATRRGNENRDIASDYNEPGKTSTQRSDEEPPAERATILDENRREAARENDRETAPRSPSGKNLKSNDEQLRKNDHVETDIKSSSRGNRETETVRSSMKIAEEKVRKSREVKSPTKIRNFESRGSSSKRSSKETRSGYTTDSSENETLERPPLRRKKSPDVAGKSRLTGSKKTASRSRPTTDTDGDPDEREQRKRSEKRALSSHRRRASTETDEDTKDRGSSNHDFPRPPPRQTDKTRYNDRAKAFGDSNDPTFSTITKSDTFPPDNISRDRSAKPLGRSSTTEIKKQIIPLSDDSLIEDFERAQLDYLRKERSIFDHDPLDDYVDPRIETALRRRKLSIVRAEEEATQVPGQSEKKSWLAWLPFFGKRAKKEKIDETELERDTGTSKIKKYRQDETRIVQDETQIRKRISFLHFFRTLADFASEFRAFAEQNPRETRKIRILRNRCFAELLVAMIYCGLGAFVFRFTEGAFETFYKCGVKRVKRDFLDSLWNFSHNLREEDWKSMARRKLMEFEEQLHTAHEAGVHSYSGQKSWSFLNAVLYCLTVITTIGYGHISPSTTTGRAITIVYAIFGIPMFLIILADFGKLFTRGIKFLWAFVRRVYYTGSCRRVRRTVPVQEVMKGVQLVYDLATFRRPSQMNPEDIEEMEKQQNQTQTVLNLDGNAPPSAQPDTPGTPALSTFAIDDEFNLPISVAIVILLAYIFVGATVYNFWEQWGFFESFYFVFISMSTIGFGDYVPKHPIYMMLSIVYLVFGLALTSMCINVVQVMLSDSFRQASQKIGATIGFEVTEEDGSVHPAAPPPVEVADVHTTIKESESEEQVAPRAKQEDLEL